MKAIWTDKQKMCAFRTTEDFLKVRKLVSIPKRWGICKIVLTFGTLGEWTEFYKRKVLTAVTWVTTGPNQVHLCQKYWLQIQVTVSIYTFAASVPFVCFNTFKRIAFTLGKLSPNIFQKQVQVHWLSITLVFCHNNKRIAVLSQMKYTFSPVYLSDNCNTKLQEEYRNRTVPGTFKIYLRKR